MIHVFFVPGMFGSFVEAALMSFTGLDGRSRPSIGADGSMHTFRKQCHITNENDFAQVLEPHHITTCIYPWSFHDFDSIISQFQTLPSWNTDKKILIHAADQRWAEINMLFQYHKISLGLGFGLDIFGGSAISENVAKWDHTKNALDGLRRWQQREMLSLFYPQWIAQWIDVDQQVSDDWFVSTNQMVLESTAKFLDDLVDYCELDFTDDIQTFAGDYQSKQQYIMDEYDSVLAIVDAVIGQNDLIWSPLSLIGEAILQHHLRSHGIELHCDGLDILPTNSVELTTLLYKPDKEIHA